MLRACPLCTLRPAAVIDPACLVCAGHGTLPLGDALHEYDPQTVSTAIALALEVIARQIDRRPDARSTNPAPAIQRALAQLEKAGLLAPPKSPAPAPRQVTGTRTGASDALVHKAIGRRPDETDQRMIRAHPYPLTHADRPLGLPLLSENFHPSSLARVGNPVPFDTDTLTILNTRAKRRYDARAIIYYLTGAAP